MTQLSTLLCQVRQLLDDKDEALIAKNAAVLMRLYDELKRQITKFCKDDKHKLVFHSSDIILIAEEAKIILNKINKRINVNVMIKAVTKPEKINDEFMAGFTESMCSVFYLTAKLTEFHSVMCYLGTLLYLLEIQYEQGELDSVLISTLKEYLGK